MSKTPTLREADTLRDGRWYRLHPLTPVLRGGLVAAGLVGVLFATLWETVVLRVILNVLGIEEEEQPEFDPAGRFLESISTFSGGFLLVVVVIAVAIWLQWRVHMVRMDDDVIEVKSGVVFRSSRRARRDRVNAVGIRQPFIPRLLGLAKLDIQAAGSDANVVLAYLPRAVAMEVRREILAPPLAAGEKDDVAADDVKRVVEVPLLRYFASLVVSVETILFVMALGVVIVLAVQARDVASWLGVVIVLFVYAAFLADRFFRVGSFVIDTVNGDIRVSLGLLATSVETIPPHRFHALQVSQPWPWRLWGWWRIDANLASTPGSQNKKAPSTSVICPVATTADMIRIVQLCVPGLATEVGSTLLQGSLEETSTSESLDQVGSPSRARVLLPLSVSVNRAWYVDGMVVIRKGAWIRRLIVVPLARVQSSSVEQGIVHRMARLARFSIQGVSGPVNPRLSAIDEQDATKWWTTVNARTIEAVASPRPPARSRQKRGATP